MNLQNRQTPLDVRGIHHHLAVKAARSQEGRIQHVGTVGGRQHNDAGIALKAVHLREDLVEGLLPFVIAAPHPGAALTAHSVNLVNEDQAGGVVLRLLEEVPHPAGSHTHKHLHELGAGEGKKRHPGFPGNGFGQQGFAGARWPHQQSAFGNTGPHRGEALRRLQEGDNFLEILFGLFHAGHVIEGDTGFRLHHEAGLGLAELHGLSRATGEAAGAPGQEDQGTNEQQRQQQITQHPPHRRGWPWRMDIKADVLLPQLIQQIRRKAR